MRRVNRGLNDFLVPFGRKLVQKQRQQNRNRKGNQQVPDAHGQRVGQQPRKIRRIEKPFKVFQPHPLAAPDALRRLVVPEGNLQPVHRIISEDKEVSHRRK